MKTTAVVVTKSGGFATTITGWVGPSGKVIGKVIVNDECDRTAAKIRHETWTAQRLADRIDQ